MTLKFIQSLLVLMLTIGFKQTAIANKVSHCANGLSIEYTSQTAREHDWKVFDEFFAAASLNQSSEDIIQHFSDIDRSRKTLADQLSEFDKYKKYSRVTILGKDATNIAWGAYRIRNYNFKFNGKRVTLPQAIYCSEKECKMSMVLENGSNTGNVISSILQMRKSEAPANCLISQEISAELHPDSNSGKLDHPISIMIGVESFSKINPPLSITNLVSGCSEISQTSNPFSLSEKALNCKTLTSDGDYISTFTLAKDANFKEVILANDVFQRLLSNINPKEKVYKYSHELADVFFVKSIAKNGDPYFFMFPIANNGKIVNDFAYSPEFTILSQSAILRKIFEDTE